MTDGSMDRRAVVRVVSATAVCPAALAGAAQGDRNDSRSTSTGTDGTRARQTAAPFGQTAVLGAEDGEAGDLFGASVALSSDGGTALVGANGDEDPSGAFAGSAYVFARSDGGWAQQAKLVPRDTDQNDEFGVSVALSGDGETALVGAPYDEDPNGTTGEQFGGAGSAYVFSRSSGDWTQQAKLTADDGEPLDNFGYSVTLADDGGTALVGARGGPPSSNFGGPGSAYVFGRDGADWTQQTRLAADDGDEGDRFGGAVSLAGDGTVALVGAPGDENDGTLVDEGSAYVFTGSGGSWTQQTKLTADDSDSADSFGSFLDLSDDGGTALVGATFDEDPNGASAGSAYVFSGSGGSWTQQAKLVADEGNPQARFGAVALAGDSALVGAFRNDDSGRKAGAAYLFERGDTGWQQRRQFLPGDVGVNDQFGYVVGLSADENTALVGAVPFQGSTAEDRPGSVYVFRRGAGATSPSETGPETTWTTAGERQTTNGSGPGFGLLSGLTALAVGAYRWSRTGESG